MFVRCAHFLGDVAEKDREEFRKTILEKALPTIAKMPGCRDVRACWSREIDEDAPGFFLVLQHFYDSLEALHSALESDVRMEVWDAMEPVMPLFNGKIVHINFEVSTI